MIHYNILIGDDALKAILDSSSREYSTRKGRIGENIAARIAARLINGLKVRMICGGVPDIKAGNIADVSAELDNAPVPIEARLITWPTDKPYRYKLIDLRNALAEALKDLEKGFNGRPGYKNSSWGQKH